MTIASHSSGARTLPRPGPCDDGITCTVDDACSGGACVGTQLYDTPCDDGDACSIDDRCHGFYCAGIGGICDDHNPCTNDACDSQTGACSHEIDDGNWCDDEDLCTLGEACHGGVCSGSIPLDCHACPAGSESINGSCRMTYDIYYELLDNQASTCDGYGVFRFNDCDGSAYGFHWTDLGGNMGAVTGLEIRFESDNLSTTLTLNGELIGSFTPFGDCLCWPLRRVPVSLHDRDPSAYLYQHLHRR
jgi:Dictyostelium (slime mold) repeat